MLFPTSAVAINLEGFSIYKLNVFPSHALFLVCISSLSLFTDTKAISIPEKKAEKNKEMINRIRSSI
jgi:hypothetical protein